MIFGQALSIFTALGIDDAIVWFGRRGGAAPQDRGESELVALEGGV